MTAVAEEQVCSPESDVTQAARATGFAWTCRKTEDGQQCDIPLSHDRDEYVWHMRHVHGKRMHNPRYINPAQKRRGRKKGNQTMTVKSSDSTVTAMPAKAKTTDLARSRAAVKRAAAVAGNEFVEVIFSYEKETKNKIRFQEEGLEGVIDTLYVSKRVLDKMGNPDSLKVIITPAD